ncbi:MAG: TonB-dependent receptor [Croceibacterium sp.]
MRDEDDQPPAAPKSRARAPIDEDEDDEAGAQPSSAIVVSARALDDARSRIDAGLGATVYTLTNETIENRPGGETGTLAAILAQAPGVVPGAGGLTVRGSVATQIRINNVIVPAVMTDPADHISARFAQTTRLLTGTLSAQFGFAPAGVISVTTKNGLYQHGGEAEAFGGTDGMLEPAIEWASSAGRASLFGSANFEHVRASVADAAGQSYVDRRDELEGLGFVDHLIGDKDRLSFLIGGSSTHQRFGPSFLPAGTEHNNNGYGAATFQHSSGGLTVQASVFAGESSVRTRVAEQHATFGTQVDASAEVGAAHVMRFGLLASYDTVTEVGLARLPASRARIPVALYAQDEWKITDALTFDLGVRTDWLTGIDSAVKVQPRASLVWETQSGFTAHAGYARYASASSLDAGYAAASLPVERDDYLDIGAQHRFGGFTIGVDGYTRNVRNYLAEHSAIGWATLVAFEFRSARLRGLELSTTFASRGTTVWANAALSSARGRTLVDTARLFASATLAAASRTTVPLGSDRPFTFSGGVTQRFDRVSLSSDVQLSSGAPWTSEAANPNGARHSNYAVFALAAIYHARLPGKRTDLRIDATDLTNVHAVTNDARSLEGGWTQRVQGRAVSAGIEMGF